MIFSISSELYTYVATYTEILTKKGKSEHFMGGRTSAYKCDYYLKNSFITIKGNR